MIEVPVDFNAIARDGLVVASKRRIQGDVRVGDVVIASAPEDEMRHRAQVVAVEDRKIYLEVEWDENLYNVMPLSTAMFTFEFGRAAERGGSIGGSVTAPRSGRAVTARTNSSSMVSA